MTKFFKNIETLEDLRREYKKLIFMYHPDRQGGNVETVNYSPPKRWELVSKDVVLTLQK